MADKEVTTFVIDVGPHMAHVSKGNTSNDLQIGLTYVKDIVITKAMKGRKTDYLTAFLNGTDDSDDMRDHVVNLHGIKAPTYDDIKAYDLDINGNEVEDDLIMAGLLGSLEMFKFVKKLKFKKNLVLVTNSLRKAPSFEEDDVLDQMVGFLNENSIKLVIVGVDFDDHDADKSTVEAWNKLRTRVNDAYVLSGPTALDCINYSSLKLTRPTKLFEVQLRISADLLDPQLYKDEEAMSQPRTKRTANKNTFSWKSFQDDESCLSIPVEGYSAVKAARPSPLKVFGLSDSGEAKPMNGETTYEIRNYNDDVDNMIELENNDEEDLLNKNFEVEPVERDQLVEGFRYGKHTIVLKDLLSKQRTYTTIPGLDIRGVVEASKLPRIYMTKEAILVFGSKESNNDQMAIAALVDVLTEMESYAIARFVKTPTSNVSMCVLIPVYIKKNGGISTKRTEGDEDLTETRAFILNTLPFFEDEKISTFPRLTTLRTTSGKEIDSKNDLLPSSEIDDAMDSLVQKMDLGSDSTDFEGDRIIFNPTLAASLLPLPVSRGNHDNLVKLSTGVHYRERAIKDIIIKSLSYSKGLKEYVKQDNIIPPLPKELEKDTLPDPKPFSSAEYDLKQLAKLVDAKPVDKTKPRKRRVVTDEIDELGMDDDFEELSLDQLLLKGLD